MGKTRLIGSALFCYQRQRLLGTGGGHGGQQQAIVGKARQQPFDQRAGSAYLTYRGTVQPNARWGRQRFEAQPQPLEP